MNRLKSISATEKKIIVANKIRGKKAEEGDKRAEYKVFGKYCPNLC